jgi:hypothetical protein
MVCASSGTCILDLSFKFRLDRIMPEVPPILEVQPPPKTAHGIAPWLWAASLLLVLPLAEYLTVGPVGTYYLIMLPGLLIWPAFVGLVYLLASPMLLIPRPSRRQILRRCGLCLVLVASTIAGLRCTWSIRNDAFHRLAQRSNGLIIAIKNYEHSNGSPPPSLDSLVPKFLDVVPGTGMAAYPDYHYLVGEGAVRFEQNPWILLVPTPSGGINFDEFLYFPLQNYPKSGYGGWLQRIGDWAYVHE